jgi:hypothetical protein
MYFPSTVGIFFAGEVEDSGIDIGSSMYTNRDIDKDIEQDIGPCYSVIESFRLLPLTFLLYCSDGGAE